VIVLVPFVLVVSYLLVTLALFFWGPFDWSVDNYDYLLLFLGAVVFSLFIGFLIGSIVPLCVSSNKSSLNYAKIGVVAGIILFLPMSFAYTGKMPWEIFYTIKDQGASYSELQNYLKNDNTLRSFVSFAKLILSPYLYTIIPLFIIHMKTINIKWKLLFLLYLLTIVSFSLLRGTDIESADIAIMAISGFLISFGRSIHFREIKIRPKKILFNSIVIIVIISIMGGLFIERKRSRLGNFDEFCIYETKICAEYTNDSLSLRQNFAYAMLTAYLAQGYYGLSIALDKEFQPTMGLGHSFFMMSLYVKLFNDTSIYEKSYLYRMKESGWDDLSVWSTVFPWIASDTSFWGVPIVIFILGILFSLSWREAIFKKNDTSVMVFSFLLIFFIYMPANNQIAQAPHSYFSCIFWLVVWIFQKIKFMR
jgi:hypothetical protein